MYRPFGMVSYSVTAVWLVKRFGFKDYKSHVEEDRSFTGLYFHTQCDSLLFGTVDFARFERLQIYVHFIIV